MEQNQEILIWINFFWLHKWKPFIGFFQFFGVEILAKCNQNMENEIEFTHEIFLNFLKILV